VFVWLSALKEAERRNFSTSDSTNIATWVNQAAGYADASQATAGARPLLVHDGTRWVVRGDGSSYYMIGEWGNVPVPRTIIATVKLAATTGEQTVVGYEETTSGTDDPAFILKPADNSLNFGTGPGVGAIRGGSTLYRAGISAGASTSWTIIAATFDESDTLKFYQDGVLKTTDTAGASPGGYSASLDPLVLANRVGATPTITDFMNGDCTGVVISSKEFNAAEMDRAMSFLNDEANLGLSW
jgi:hypothetical protein